MSSGFFFFFFFFKEESNSNKLVKIAATFEQQNIGWKSIIHTCEEGSLRSMEEFSKENYACRNRVSLLSLLNCENK